MQSSDTTKTIFVHMHISNTTNIYKTKQPTAHNFRQAASYFAFYAYQW